MMKIYRCSFWSTHIILSTLIAMAVSFAIFIPFSIKEGFSWLKIVTGILIAFSFPLCMSFFSGFYIILLNDALIVKNVFCPFWKKKVYFKDRVIIKVIALGGMAVPYIQLFTGKTKWAWRYYLDHVKYKDLPELVTLLREKGMEVKAKVWKGLTDNDYLE